LRAPSTLHLAQGDHLHAAIAGEPRRGLEIEVRAGRHNREEDAGAVSAANQRLEHLLGRQPHLARDGLGREVLFVDFVLAQLVADPECLEDPRGVRLH
jgi:hypothetical protein